jgi:hypothetical protein
VDPKINPLLKKSAMAGRMIHEMGQEADKSLKEPAGLGCSLHKSGYFCEDVIKC